MVAADQYSGGAAGGIKRQQSPQESLQRADLEAIVIVFEAEHPMS